MAHLYEGPLCHLEGREFRIVTLQVHHNMGVKDAKADRCCMFCFLNLFVETPKSEIFAYTFQSNEYADSRHLCEASGRRHGGGACAFPYGLMDSISTSQRIQHRSMHCPARSGLKCI